MLNRHRVGGFSRSPDGLFGQQEREPIRGMDGPDSARRNRAPGPHRNTARQAMDGLWTEARGQQKQSNDPGNNQQPPRPPTLFCGLNLGLELNNKNTAHQYNCKPEDFLDDLGLSTCLSRPHTRARVPPEAEVGGARFHECRLVKVALEVVGGWRHPKQNLRAQVRTRNCSRKKLHPVGWTVRSVRLPDQSESTAWTTPADPADEVTDDDVPPTLPHAHPAQPPAVWSFVVV